MARKDKFFRTVVEIEILSRSRIPPDIGSIGLSAIADEIIMGSWSGNTKVTTQDEVEPQEMAQMLMNQRSSPGFLGLKEDGSEDEEWE